MRAGLPVRGCRQRLANAFRLNFRLDHSGLEIEQVELRLAELLAARTVLPDPQQPQLLSQRLDLQMGQCQFPLQSHVLIGFGSPVSGCGGIHASK